MSTQNTHRTAWGRTKSLKLEGYVNNFSEFTSKITWNSLNPYHRREVLILQKVGISIVRARKACRASGYRAPLILNLGIKPTWVVSFTPASDYTRERTPVLTEEESQSTHAGRTGMCRPTSSEHSIVTVPTTLPRLRLMLCRETNLYLPWASYVTNKRTFWGGREIADFKVTHPFYRNF